MHRQQVREHELTIEPIAAQFSPEQGSGRMSPWTGHAPGGLARLGPAGFARAVARLPGGSPKARRGTAQSWYQSATPTTMIAAAVAVVTIPSSGRPTPGRFCHSFPCRSAPRTDRPAFKISPQVLLEGPRRAIVSLRIFLETLPAHRLLIARHSHLKPRGRDRVVVNDLVHRLDGRRRLERGTAGQKFVEDRA